MASGPQDVVLWTWARSGGRGARCRRGGFDLSQKPPKIALIDGYSLFHRAFFALPPLTDGRGRPTGAVYGFLAMLLRLLDEQRPTHLAVALDMSGPTFRHEAFDDYKAHRPETPDELGSQFPLLRQALSALRVPVVEHQGVEADDVLGTLSLEAARAGFETLVVTGDRDALQLAGDSVRIVLTRRGISDTEVLDAERIRERYGLEPAQLVDVKALCGDTSDNIPGVPTIGEKTALKLVVEYGSIQAVLDHLDAVRPPRVQKALTEHRDMLPRNRRLAQIVRDVPLGVDLKDLARREPDPAAARELFEELGFGSLLKRLDLPQDPPPEPAAAVLEVEAVPLPDDLEPESVAVRIGEDGALYLATADRVYRTEDPAAVARFDQGPGKLGYDLKPWIRRLIREGRKWRQVRGDALVAAYLLDPGRSSYPMEDLARQYLERRVGGAAAPVRADFDLCSAVDAEIEARGLARLYNEVELPLIEVLAAMEAHGVCVDRGVLEELRVEFAGRVAAAEAAVYEAVDGERFNVNSTQQLAQVLFERLGLKPPKRTKTGYSTDAEVLERLSLEHPLPERVLEYRTLQKLQSTYVEALGGLIDPGDGRIHTTFSQTTAATGRLASSGPNLQNIPVREEVGRRIRRVFVAPPGHVLVAADYSQVELRLLAEMSGDADLRGAFAAGVDFHRQTAAQVFGVPEDQVTAEQRGAAKATSFGIVYGISDFGLARQLRTTQAEAHEIIQRYFARFPGVKAYLDRSVAEARQHGFARTLFGRVRQLPDITSRNWTRRSFAERMAMNSPLQGTAADLIKIAMVRAHREIEEGGLRARLILQVHDELIFEAPADERSAVADLARRCMEGAGEGLAVPLVVEVEAGPNWADLRPIDPEPGPGRPYGLGAEAGGPRASDAEAGRPDAVDAEAGGPAASDAEAGGPHASDAGSERPHAFGAETGRPHA